MSSHSDPLSSQSGISRAADGRFKATGPLPTAPGGRPRALDDEAKRLVVGGLEKGWTLSEAAAFVACDRRTIRRERQCDPHFDLAVKRAIEMQTLGPLEVIIRASRDNWRAAAWLVKYQRTLEKDSRQARELKRLLESIDNESDPDHARRPLDSSPPPRLTREARFQWPPLGGAETPSDSPETNGHEGNGHPGEPPNGAA